MHSIAHMKKAHTRATYHAVQSFTAGSCVMALSLRFNRCSDGAQHTPLGTPATTPHTEIQSYDIQKQNTRVMGSAKRDVLEESTAK